MWIWNRKIESIRPFEVRTMDANNNVLHSFVHETEADALVNVDRLAKRIHDYDSAIESVACFDYRAPRRNTVCLKWKNNA